MKTVLFKSLDLKKMREYIAINKLDTNDSVDIRKDKQKQRQKSSTGTQQRKLQGITK